MWPTVTWKTKTDRVMNRADNGRGDDEPWARSVTIRTSAIEKTLRSGAVPSKHIPRDEVVKGVVLKSKHNPALIAGSSNNRLKHCAILPKHFLNNQIDNDCDVA